MALTQIIHPSCLAVSLPPWTAFLLIASSFSQYLIAYSALASLSMRPRQNPRVLHSDLGFLDLCNRENVMVVGLPFSVNVRAFPKGTQSGQIAIEK